MHLLRINRIVNIQSVQLVTYGRCYLGYINTLVYWLCFVGLEIKCIIYIL